VIAVPWPWLARADEVAAVHMEAIGTFQTSRHVRSPVAIGGKADVLCSG